MHVKGDVMYREICEGFLKIWEKVLVSMIERACAHVRASE